MKAVGIEWDFDDGDKTDLPTEIDIPEGMTDEDEISDYLSDVTGFCHKGFSLRRDFSDVKPGDKIICFDEYSHDYEEREFLVESVEIDKEEGVVAYGKDLDYHEDESDDYIGRVCKSNFVGYEEEQV